MTRISSTGENISALLIDDICRDPELWEEAKVLAPEMAEAMRRDICREPDRSKPLNPAHPDYAAWYRIMQPLMLFAPPRNLPTGDLGVALWLRQGYEALAEMPLSILDKAVHWYIGNATKAFFPTWGELKAIATRECAGEFQALYVIRAAARRQPPKPEIVKTPEEKAAVARMLAEFHAQPMPDAQRKRETPQEMAARLRAMTAQSLGTESFA